MASASRDVSTANTTGVPECLQAIQKAEDEAVDIAAARLAAAAVVELDEPFYEAGGLPPRELEKEAAGEDAFQTDYLAPFLPLGPRRTLTATQAQNARAACLKVRSREHLSIRSHPAIEFYAALEPGASFKPLPACASGRCF